jgi:hypothetical protein
MPSTDRKLELKAKTSVAQTGLQPFVYAKGLKNEIKIQYISVPKHYSLLSILKDGARCEPSVSVFGCFTLHVWTSGSKWEVG